METHGLNEYYSYARNGYAAILRTPTMDPHAESYYDTSPYGWLGNNPVNRIDPTGEDDFYVQMGADSTLVVTIVVTGDNTPNRLFIQDSNADENTENRMEFEGNYYEMNMIPSQYYSEEDYQSEGLFGTSQFDRDRHEYISNGKAYTDKNWLQRTWTSWNDDPVTWDQVAPVLSGGGKGGKAASGFAHDKTNTGGKLKGARGDSHDAQYTHGGKHRPTNPNKRKGADDRKNKGKRIN